MKILIGMTRSDTIVSGSFQHVCQIGERFRKEGIDVVYVLGGEGPARKKLEEKGFKVYGLKILRRELSLFRDPVALLAMLKIIIQEKPDICSWHTAKIGALGRFASFLTGRKSYYVPHGVPFVDTPENKGHKTYAKIEKLLSYLPSKIIGVCEFDRNEYIRIGVNPNRLLVIKNGMPAVSDIPPAINKSKLVKFITAARFEAQKDYETLAQACHLLVQEGLNFQLDIYGDGQQEKIVKGYFSGLPSGIVNFKGVVDNFAEKLIEADVFLLSSFWEGLPRSIIEAMACHKPVIASDVGGANELIDDGKTGFLIPVRDATAFADAMRYYINNNGAVQNQGENAYKYYLSKYTLDKMLDQYCKVYFAQAIG